MAKHPDEPNPKKKPDHDHPEQIDEVEEIFEADLEEELPPVRAKKPHKEDDPPAPPTQVAPLEWDSGGTVQPGPAYEEHDGERPGYSGPAHPHMPNLSLDEPALPGSYLTIGGPSEVFHDEQPAPKAPEDSWVAEAAAEAEVVEVEPESDVLEAEVVEHTGNSSVVEAAEVVEEPSGVFADEPIEATGSSSVVVSEVADHDPSSEVMAEEFADIKHDSSVISASVLEAESAVEAAEVAEDESIVEALPASDVVLSVDEVTAASGSSVQDVSGMKAVQATPPPLKADDVFEADFMAIQEEEEANREASSIFGADVPEEEKPIVTESMAHKEEAFDEILESTEPLGQILPSDKTPKKPKKVQPEAVEEDTVDLGSDPEVNVDASELEKLWKERAAHTAPKKLPEPEQDIDWDDVQTMADSHVVKEMDDAGQTMDTFSAPAQDAADAEEDFIAAEDVDADDGASGVDLGKKANGKHPLSGIDPVAEALESGVDLDEAPARKKKKTRAEHEATELDAEALVEPDEVQFDQTGAHAAKVYDEHEDVAALVEDDVTGEETPDASMADEEIAPAKATKGGKKAPDNAKLVGAGQGGGRGWLTGALVTTGVFAVLFAVLWFLAPGLLETIGKSSPTASAPVREVVKTDQTQLKMLQARAQKAEEELKIAQIDGGAGQKKLVADLVASKAKEFALKEQLEKAEAAKLEAGKDLSAVADVLVKEKLLSDTDKLDPATMRKIIGDLADNKGGLAAVNKMLEEAKIKDPGEQGVAKLVAAKKEVEEKIDTLNKMLAEEMATREKIAKDRDELDQTLKGAYKELAGGADEDPRGKIVDAVKRMRDQADSPLTLPVTQIAKALGGLGNNAGKMLGDAFNYAALAGELAFYRAREPLILTPERKLDYYIALFQNEGTKDRAEADLAVREVAWVLSKDSHSSSEAQVKALIVTGLIGRQQGNYEAARKILELATKTGAAYADTQWMKTAAAVLHDLSEPNAFYLPRAEKSMLEGDPEAASEVLNAGLKAFPANPRLLVRRSLVRLELAQGKKAQVAKLEKEIRADAEAAAKDPDAAPEAAFVLGLLEQELGHYDKAESEYRKAIKAHHGSPEDYSRYVIALARLLQRERGNVSAPIAPSAEEPAPAKEKDTPAAQKSAHLAPLRAFLACALIGVQISDEDLDEDPATAARLKESMELANKLIESTNSKIKGQGYMILGQALSKMGRRTDGLKEYVKGLELLYPGTVSKEIAKLLDDHPAFQQPEATRANPVLAEQYFGKGLHAFWSQSYAEAEAQFKKAVQSYNLDARYQYYLGMALLAQKGSGKRAAAYHALEQGARLEAANRPSVNDVNASLERVQGSLRALVDRYRQQAIVAAN